MQIGDKIIFDRFEWCVLDIQSGKALIITENIIEERAYHRKQRRYSPRFMAENIKVFLTENNVLPAYGGEYY
jgi:hypothetical protein